MSTDWAFYLGILCNVCILVHGCCMCILLWWDYLVMYLRNPQCWPQSKAGSLYDGHYWRRWTWMELSLGNIQDIVRSHWTAIDPIRSFTYSSALVVGKVRLCASGLNLLFCEVMCTLLCSPHKICVYICTYVHTYFTIICIHTMHHKLLSASVLVTSMFCTKHKFS